MKKKLITKGILLFAAIVISIWNLGQISAIEKGTKELPMEYGQYHSSDEYGEYREANVCTMLEIGTEVQQSTYGSYMFDEEVVGYYCIMNLDDGTTGVVKVDSLGPYRSVLIESAEDYYRQSDKTIAIRGKTAEMPRLSYFPDIPTVDEYMAGEEFEVPDPMDVIEQNNSVNEYLDGITLLDATVETPDTYIYKPNLFAFTDGFELILYGAALALGVLFVNDLLIYRKAKLLGVEIVDEDADAFNDAFAAVNLLDNKKKSEPVSVSNAARIPAQNAGQPLTAENIVAKMHSFRKNGVAQTEIDILGISICKNNPEYIEQHFNEYFEAVNKSFIPQIYVLGECMKENKFDQAYRIFKPLMDYLETNKAVLLQNKYCFNDAFEAFMYYYENGLSTSVHLEQTDRYYLTPILMYVKLLIRMAASDPGKGEECLKYLKIAEGLCNVSAGVQLHYAAYYEKKDRYQWKQHMDKALKFSYLKEEPYNLATIYYAIGLYYLKINDIRVCAASMIMTVRYGGADLVEKAKAVLNKINITQMSEENAAEILKSADIQVGYGRMVRRIGLATYNNPQERDKVRHIVEDTF